MSPLSVSIKPGKNREVRSCSVGMMHVATIIWSYCMCVYVCVFTFVCLRKCPRKLIDGVFRDHNSFIQPLQSFPLFLTIPLIYLLIFLEGSVLAQLIIKITFYMSILVEKNEK